MGSVGRTVGGGGPTILGELFVESEGVRLG